MCNAYLIHSFIRYNYVSSVIKYSRARLIRTANARKNRASDHANYQSLIYITFLSMAESCVQSKRAN